MRTLLLTLLLLVGCTPYRPPPKFDQLVSLTPRTACFDTFHGIRVYASEGASCPPQVEVERMTRHALERTGADLSDVWGAQTIYVPSRIWCSDGERFGCTVVDETRADIVVTDRLGSWTSLLHELGHVIRFRRYFTLYGSEIPPGKPTPDWADGPHKDCVYWRRLHNRPCGVWEVEGL